MIGGKMPDLEAKDTEEYKDALYYAELGSPTKGKMAIDRLAEVAFKAGVVDASVIGGQMPKALNKWDEQLREKVCIQLVARDDDISFMEASTMWLAFKTRSLEGHYGDCTNQPVTCALCLVECFNEEATEILALIKEAGYVKLADDQDLPQNPMSQNITLGRLYQRAQQEMLAAGFRKVELWQI